jgi:NTE family protein
VTDDKFLLLKMHGCSKGLSDAALREIADAAELLRCRPGEYLHHAHHTITSVFLLIHGRLSLSLIDVHGNVILQRYQTAGGQFGAVAAALSEPTEMDVIAQEPSTLLRLDYSTALALTKKHEKFRKNFSHLIANQIRGFIYSDKYRRKPTIVSVFHESPASRPLTPRLIRRLLEFGESPCVFSDRTDWEPIDKVTHRALLEGERTLNEEEVRRQLSTWGDNQRVFIDIDAALLAKSASTLFEVSEKLLWCVSPDNWEAAVRRLKEIKAQATGWKDKITVVWLLDGDQQVSPWAPGLMELVSSDFKLSLSQPSQHQRGALANGFERLVHELRGIRIGVALGGGAARGMAHLGVLKALEQNGICVDMIAGTSAGAMTGTLYASGMDADYGIECFMKDLKPSWLFRLLPRGDQWHLLYKYRRGHFDPMLRKYLADSRLEQLPIPMQTVTVDLVSGNSIVRDHGDAVQAVVESINLPVLSAPICREGAVLVDGGLVNNIPADVLVAKGCNFVIAVSVTAKMEQQFAKNRPDTPTAKMKSASTLQTILRSYLVQSKNMNSVGVQPADVVIEPDVTEFELTEFNRTDELAAAGEKATLEVVPKIKKALAQLDHQMFALDGMSGLP